MLRAHQGKGNKDRYTVLSPWLLEVLLDYWRQFRPQGPWLFPAPCLQDKPMVDGSAQLIFCRASKRAGLPNRVAFTACDIRLRRICWTMGWMC